MILSWFAVVLLAPGASGGESCSTGELSFEERVVAGGAPGDFMIVRYLRLAGSQRAIGRQLAEIARQRHGFVPPPSEDALRTRAIRRYFEKNSPLQLERMRGAAELYQIRLEDDRASLDGLPFGLGRPGCSVVYYPPSWTAS